MIKWYEVKWMGETLWGQSYSDSKLCDTEEEANTLIERLKIKENVTKIWKTTIERIQQSAINHLVRGDFLLAARAQSYLIPRGPNLLNSI